MTHAARRSWTQASQTHTGHEAAIGAARCRRAPRPSSPAPNCLLRARQRDAADSSPGRPHRARQGSSSSGDTPRAPSGRKDSAKDRAPNRRRAHLPPSHKTRRDTRRNDSSFCAPRAFTHPPSRLPRRRVQRNSSRLAPASRRRASRRTGSATSCRHRHDTNRCAS